MQQFQLSIPEPCHQSWEQMTPTEQGRFCKACAKEVIDFSMMTDSEVLNYFNTLSHENVCGRALPTQLERNITPYANPVKKRFWYWHYITMLFLFFNKTSNAKPQGGIAVTDLNKKGKTPLVSNFQFSQTEKYNTANSRIISGKITDDNNKGIPYAIVKIKGTGKMVKADAYGVYVIKVNTATDFLELSAPGYPAKIFGLSGLQTFNFSISNNATEIIVTAGMMIKRPVKQNVIEKITPITISGTITDSEGNAVPYASVKIKNTSTGTGADSAGTFTLSAVRAFAEIEFSALGFTTKTIAANELKTNSRIILERKLDNSLQEVKVISYGGVTKGKISTMGGISSYSVCTVRTLSDTVKLMTTKITGALKVYPNPVSRGSVLNIDLKIKQTGNYRVQVSDAAGKVVLQRQLIGVSKQQTMQMPTDIKWSAGIYYINVFDTNNKLISTSNFIVK